jgi:rhamnulokinase
MGTSFALLDEEDRPVEEIISGRVPQEPDVLRSVFSRIPAREAYRITGLQPKKLNSLFLLAKFQRDRPDILERTRTFLMLPDLITFWLTGVKACELSEAGTSWLLDIHTGTWSDRLIHSMNLDRAWFPTIVRPGTITAPLLPSLAGYSHLKETQVIFGASHDTASAFAAVQHRYGGSDNLVQHKGSGWILSCGTWSILGSVEEKPIVSDDAFQGNCANEPAYDDRIMFVSNSVNLWIWEEFCRQLRRQGESYTHEELTWLAETAVETAETDIPLIDPMAPEFLLSEDIIRSIQAHCAGGGERRQGSEYESRGERGQGGGRVPEGPAEIARVILKSLVENYRRQFERHVSIKGELPAVLYLIGGGSRNELLCQWTADALGIPVRAGLPDATALGNGLIQLAALGDIHNRDFPAIIDKSACFATYTPLHK